MHSSLCLQVTVQVSTARKPAYQTHLSLLRVCRLILLGDIYSEKPLFNNKDHAGLESIFMIEESIDDDTLYIVEESAWEYYI